MYTKYQIVCIYCVQTTSDVALIQKIYYRCTLWPRVESHNRSHLYWSVRRNIYSNAKHCGVRSQNKCHAKTARSLDKAFMTSIHHQWQFSGFTFSFQLIFIGRPSMPLQVPPHASTQRINSRTQAFNDNKSSNYTPGGRDNAIRSPHIAISAHTKVSDVIDKKDSTKEHAKNISHTKFDKNLSRIFSLLPKTIRRRANA